jgi:endonuclease/exonuclease/phosphatase family metal-dependent hydrolase
VIVFSEAFDDKVRQYLLANLPGYPHRSRILGQASTVEKKTRMLPAVKNGQINGGVLIVSKWPIIKERHKIYKATAFPDSLSAKGVLGVTVEMKGRRFHVFGTHLQAGKRGKKNSRGPDIRFRQVQDIQKLITKWQIPQAEPVFVAGDLNMNKFSTKKVSGDLTEYQRMMKTLGMTLPALSGDERQLIDYVLYSKHHKAPKAASLRKHTFFAIIDKKKSALSDHPAVHGIFHFEPIKSRKKKLY